MLEELNQKGQGKHPEQCLARSEGSKRITSLLFSSLPGGGNMRPKKNQK